MFTRTLHHGHHSEVETVIKWAILLILGTALMWVMAREAGGAPPAVGAMRIPAHKPDTPPYPMTWPEQDVASDWQKATTIWRIIDLHNTDKHDQAETLWNSLELPSDKAHWQLIGQAFAAFGQEDCERAAALLEEARAMVPNHPLPHYYLGLVHLRQAANVHEYFDDAGPQVGHLVASVPNRAKLLDKATTALLTALDLAPAGDAQEPLLSMPWVAPSAHSLEMPLAVPTAMDLLEAINGNDFEADAHWRLGAIYLDRDNMADAEQHWDEATALGRDLRSEYRLLAKIYETDGDHLAATRTHTKSMRFGGPYRVPASDAATSFFRALMSP